MKKVNNDNNSNCNVDNMLILVKKMMQKQHREKDDVATRLECRITENASRKEFALAYYSYSHEYE